MAITTLTSSILALLPFTSTPILPTILPTILLPTILLLTLAFLAWNTSSYLSLSHIPGPFLCHLTNLPRTRWVLSNTAHATHIRLHETYGPLVRFGPNMVSVSDPREIATLYSFTKTFRKSDFYRVLVFYSRGKPAPTIFGTQDEGLHRLLRRPIVGVYGMSNLLTFEPLVDRTIEYLVGRLEEEFVDENNEFGQDEAGKESKMQEGRACDLGQWLQMFAFDVMGELTFLRRLGFLESGADVEGIMGALWAYFWKAAPLTQIPWVDRLWAKNPVLQRFQRVRMNPIVGFGLARIAERRAVVAAAKAKAKAGDDGGVVDAKEENEGTKSRDFLSRFIEAMEKDGSLPPWALSAWTTSNIAAGSDTTAILLRTIFHRLLSHPSDLSRLLVELTTLPKTDKPASFKDTRTLPFLDAVIKEAGRLHPPFGLPLERVVPDEGATICGFRLKAGTVVGMSAWVVHRDKETFGEDAGEWRPERWLQDGVKGEGREEWEARRKKMEAALLTFGAGHRVCIGKNISYLEVYKVVPELLRRFEISFAETGCPGWKVENRWFVNQTGLVVKLKKREALPSNDGSVKGIASI
ncbi:MAG: hypothetical protein OHK93_005968 [Ramalina farinacea]|uniref:Cytochrome P450 n=1 Tax=Ramalina farinacea TaxID=258253 RepID=A0AA43TSK1_9LECA|nr:hypothetical protein [Ramalina farinacea]